MQKKIIYASIFIFLGFTGFVLYSFYMHRQERQITDSIRNILLMEKSKQKPPGETYQFCLPDGESFYPGPLAGKLSDFCQNKDLQEKVQRIFEQNQNIRTECSKIYRLHLKSSQIFLNPTFLNFIFFFYCDQMALAYLHENKNDAIRIVHESFFFAQNFTNPNDYIQYLLYTRLNYMWLELIYVPFYEKFALTENESKDLVDLLKDAKAYCALRTYQIIQFMLNDSKNLSLHEKAQILEIIQTTEKLSTKFMPQRTISDKILIIKQFNNFFISRVNDEINKLETNK